MDDWTTIRTLKNHNPDLSNREIGRLVGGKSPNTVKKALSTGWQINATTTKTTYEMQLPHPIGQNYFRIKAQRADLTSESSNIAVV